MPANLPTWEDMERFKKELIEDLKMIFEVRDHLPKLLTGRDVCKMMHLSDGKLKRLRDNRELAFIKTGKKYLYDLKDVLVMIEKRKRNNGLLCILYCLVSPYVDMFALSA